MANIREIEPYCPMGPGISMRFYEDLNKPADSVERMWTETTYDGLPDSEVFYAPPHWHRYHDEHHVVIEGRVQLMVEGKTKIIGPEDGVAITPRMQVHSLKSLKGEKMVLKEYAYPAGTYKEEFFRDLYYGGKVSLVRAPRVFYDGDTYPSIGGISKWLDTIVITILGGIAKLFVPAKEKSRTKHA